jgi:amino-acid N-acetyltransferase
MSAPVIHPASAGDLPSALALLEFAGLPVAGVEKHFPARFLVARDPATGEVRALAGVEAYGDAGLLRSVVVREGERGSGLGQAISAAAVEAARRAGLRELYLLTTTASGFFPRLGFEPVPREALPETLGGSEELCGACPASAVAMRLRLV